MGVPLATEFARSKEDRQAMELVLSQGMFGRPFVLPPGVPPERAAALRKAFMAAMTDPALLSDAQEGEPRYRGAVRLRPAGPGRGAICAAAEHRREGEAVDDLQAGAVDGRSSCGWTSRRLCRRRNSQPAGDRGICTGSVEQFYRGKTINIYRRLGGGRRLRRLCARARPPHGQIHPRQSDHRAAEHAGRGRQQGGRLHLFGRAEGRHRHRRDLSRRHPRAAARRHADPARSGEVHLRRQRQQRRLHLRRPRRLPDQVLQGRVHAGDDRRRQQRRRHHPRHAGAVEQRARREIPHRHRLCRHARDRARGRAQGDPRRCAATATPACSR